MNSITLPPLKPILTSFGQPGASDPAPMLDLLFAMTQEGVALTDLSGSTVYVNRAGRRILGVGPRDVPPGSKTCGTEFYYLDDFSPIPEPELPLNRALRGEVVDGVQLFVRGAGLPEGALVSLDAAPVREASGRVIGAVSVFRDIGAQKRAEEELRVANAKLGEWVAELERRAQVVVLMNEMAELLQSCRNVREFYSVVARSAGKIFAESGAMYLVNASRSALETFVSWGGHAPAGGVFAVDGCWALRRGRIHRAGGDALGPDCEHASSEGTSGYTCIPMMGQGEALGVLHVREPEASAANAAEIGPMVAESRHRTVVSVAEHIALALANLRLRETLRTQAIRDPLTGLFNRRYMEESLERELTRSRRSSGSLAALMIDIDHFKRFNDTFGHAAADVALRDTASAIRDCLRAEDIACRYGGEELVVILPETPLDRASVVAERIRAAIEAMQVGAQGVPLGTVTASIGVAATRGDGAGPDALLRAADAALYAAKRGGRNRVCTAGERAEEAPSSGAVPRAG